MTVRELAIILTNLTAVHGDCDIVTTATDGSDFLAGIISVQPNVTPVESEAFPFVVLRVETDIV